MRTALNLPRQPCKPRKKKVPQLQCTEALHACEAAAISVKSAGEELASRWVELAHELSTGVPGTELLRTRAWCNVLELRLKERATALEEARHLLDSVWRDAMAWNESQPTESDLMDPSIPCEPTEAHWPVLAQATLNAIPAAFRSTLK